MANATEPPEISVTVIESKNLSTKPVRWNQVQLPVDVLLMTVKDCEFLSCVSFLNPGFYKSYHEKLGYVYFGKICEDDMTELNVALVKCSKGSIAPGGSTIVVKNAVEVLRPRAVFSVGFCGSLNKAKAKLGDIVVSAKLITYAPCKVSANGIQERGVSVPLKRHLANLTRSAGDGWEAPLKQPGKLEIKVHRDGVFLSGPEVVANSKRRDELCGRFPEAIAIEMEGEGLYTAAHDLDIEWIVVKGVSDFADEHQPETDSWRRFASVMAASLTAHILSDAIVFQTWPHYGGEYVPQPPLAESMSSLRVEPLITVPKSEVVVKPGNPTEEELEQLSEKIADKWDKLGRRLGFDRAKITAYDCDYRRLSEKAYQMLMDWKEKEGIGATYQVLYNALCHPFTGRKDLAVKFCCDPYY